MHFFSSMGSFFVNLDKEKLLLKYNILFSQLGRQKAFLKDQYTKINEYN